MVDKQFIKLLSCSFDNIETRKYIEYSRVQIQLVCPKIETLQFDLHPQHSAQMNTLNVFQRSNFISLHLLQNSDHKLLSMDL